MIIFLFFYNIVDEKEDDKKLGSSIVDGDRFCIEVECFDKTEQDILLAKFLIDGLKAKVVNK